MFPDALRLDALAGTQDRELTLRVVARFSMRRRLRLRVAAQYFRSRVRVLENVRLARRVGDVRAGHVGREGREHDDATRPNRRRDLRRGFLEALVAERVDVAMGE